MMFCASVHSKLGVKIKVIELWNVRCSALVFSSYTEIKEKTRRVQVLNATAFVEREEKLSKYVPDKSCRSHTVPELSEANQVLILANYEMDFGTSQQILKSKSYYSIKKLAEVDHKY